MNDGTTERIVRPRLRTTIERLRRTAGNHLPGDLLQEQVQRLDILVGVCAGLWIFGLLMDAVVVPNVTGRSMPAWAPMLDVGGIVASAAAFGYVRYIGGSCQAKINAALGYMLANAAAIAVLSTSRLPTIQPYQLSWTTVVILTSAMMIPATPAKMLLASAVAASMDPIAVAMCASHWRTGLLARELGLRLSAQLRVRRHRRRALVRADAHSAAVSTRRSDSAAMS
jgi:hypothetical protein